MAAVLQQVLEKAELAKMPKAVQAKLERFLADQQTEIDAMKSRHEKFRVDCDQQYFEVEKRLAHTQERLVSESQECQNLREQIKKQNEEQKALNEKLKDIEKSNDQLVALQNQLTRTKDSLEAEKRDLVRVNERRAQELEHLNDDIKRLSDKLKEANVSKVELQLKLDEIQSSEFSIKHREKRLEQEKELLQSQTTWLNKELKSKTDELLSIQREKGNDILELKSALENKKDEVSRLEDQVKSLKSCNENLQRQAEDLMNKLKEAKDQQTSMEEKFHNELNANVKLSNLYKCAAEDSEAKSAELTRAMEELQKLLKECGEANTLMQQQLSEAEASKCQVEKDLGEKIGKMERELENANDLLSATKRKGTLLSEAELTAMSPTAAAVAKVVKPGMKLTELYNAYVESQDQLLLEKLENKRINKYLDEIVKEVEAKAPILKRQREEYERMQKSVASLSAKLEQAMKEMQRLQDQSDKANKQSTLLERENQRLELQVKDLSQQIRVLLIEVEEARGNYVERDDNVSSDNISSSSEVISRHLVTYRSVEELQKQNLHLLVALQELAESKEKEEQETSSSRISELERELEIALSELQQLRETRTHQMQMVDSIVRQRDLYRVLLAQTTGVSMPAQDDTSLITPRKPSGPSSTSSTPAPAVSTSDSTEAAEAKAALKQLKEVFENYRKEKKENDRILNEQHEKLQDQVTDLRSQNTKISTQLEFASKRYEMLQDNVESYRREITSLQEKTQKLSATTQKQEQIIHTMTQDLRAANEKLAIAEVRAENLKREKELIKMSEVRLSQERESLITEQKGQNLLLTNLQTIQLTLERSETEMKHRYNNQIEKLERELAQTKKKLEHEIEQKHLQSKNQDGQVLDLKKQYESEVSLHSSTKELLKNSNKEISVLKQQLNNFEAQLASRSSPQTASKGKDENADEVEELKTKLRQSEEQVNDLKERLKTATSNVEQYRSVVLGLEDSLNKEKQATEEARKAIETRMKEAGEYQSQLEKKMLEAEKEKQELGDEKHKAVEAIEEQLTQLKKSLSSLQGEMQQALQRATAAANNEQKARNDCQEQARIASEAQNKYERELMLHAADVEALQAAKAQLANISTMRQKLEDAAQKAESQLLECRASWEEQERVLKQEAAKNHARCEEFEKQNHLLHDQIENLSKKMVTSVQEGALNISFSEEGKSHEQVMEILRFVRREKEIAETRFEVAQVECLRYKQRFEHMEREIHELQDCLNAEREKVQVTAKTMAQHEELMKKTETMNVLMESNRLLREDKEKLEQELQQLQAKIRKLESNILPLQESNAELSEKSGMLQAEKKLLEDDVRRWRARTQHLLNQHKDTDMEEYKKLLSERDNNVKRIQQLTEEIGKLKTEVARTNASLTTSQNQLQSLKEEMNKTKAEKENLQKDLDTKSNDIQEKLKTITQVRKIGRRYKTQYEELKVAHDKLVAETSAAQAEKVEDLASQKELQDMKDSLGQAETKNSVLESQVENLKKTVDEKENELKILHDQIAQLQPEVSRLQKDLQDKTTQEEQLRQQINEKEEKTKKALMAVKQKLAQLAGSKEQLTKENEELKQRIASMEQQREELDVRMSALKSQYEGRICRLERELREQQERHLEQRDEAQEPTKIPEQRQITLKPTTASGERGIASTSEPPTANIKPTPVVATPSKVTTANVPGNKSTPRASIRPMVTPATASTPTTTPTATVMPTTQVETQEAMQSEGIMEHVPVFGSTSGSVRSTSPNVQSSLPQNILPVQQQTQATAFVQPTQQAHATIEPSTQEPIVDVIQSSPIERPTTSSSLFSSFSTTPSSSMPKRQREEGEDSTIETTEQSLEDSDLPLNKKMRSIQQVDLEEEIDNEEAESAFAQESQEALSQDYPLMAESQNSQIIQDITAQSSDQSQNVQSSQDTAPERDDVITIDSSDDEENEGDQEEFEEDEVEDDDDTGMGEGDDSNEETGSADGNDAYDETEGADGTDPGTETEESLSASDGAQRAADSQNSGDASTGTTESSSVQETREQPSSVSDRQAPRPPQSPRRPPHSLPPRLTIHAPPQELGPPTQRIQMARRQSVGRGLQLTPGIGGMQSFFDDEDRTVPSTPTLVVPHRTDGFAEAIHSPQVAGVPRFRFGPPDDMQASSSHSDLGQLASQGGLGMYETPLFLAHEEESGGRSVPTTPLQVAAPVSVFTENPAADTSDHASQSVPMVTTSTGNVPTAVDSGVADEGDEVFVEGESEGIGSESALEMDSQQEEEIVQPSETDVPSTSQDPPSSSSADTSSSHPKPFRRVRLQPQTARTGVRGRQFTRQRGVTRALSGRGGINRSNIS
ncbi:LOW QUALITY PROTEIN: nucleoprotein TPR [Bombina bombina]|uniref:LOW QUALITY PROTEIN: nucleoprotein TPR n=1 Tax=Bombina bombina TaxID=8345 RepID=UPI00235B0964|nr:LOW QUALITY PROTEIN: nucleoprotein TPR [Bombina bombina]